MRNVQVCSTIGIVSMLLYSVWSSRVDFLFPSARLLYYHSWPDLLCMYLSYFLHEITNGSPAMAYINTEMIVLAAGGGGGSPQRISLQIRRPMKMNWLH